MDTQKKTARLAGIMYLIVVLTGIFSLAYVPSKLIEWNNPGQTYQNISSSEQLFRLGIACSMLCYLAFLILPFILYKLLHSIQENYSKLMVVLVVISVPIAFMNLENKFAVLTLISGADYLNVYGIHELHSQVMVQLDSYYSGIIILQIFWGLWLFPLGYLIYKSNFLPKILGILLMLGCVGYLIRSFGETVIPNFSQYSISEFVTLPASIGEIGTCLWLLVFGVKNKKVNNE